MFHESVEAFKEAMRKFVQQDTTPAGLKATLAKLKKMHATFGDRMGRSSKDINYATKLFGQYDSQQAKANHPLLTQGVAFLEGLCRFDPEPAKKAIDVEIKVIQDQIEASKVGGQALLHEKLADLVVEFEGGKVCELAARKHAKFEQELRHKIEGELRAKLEKEYEAKLAELTKKAQDEVKLKTSELSA